jgi:hypothetical protein
MRRNYCLFFTLSVAVQLSLLVTECQGKAGQAALQKIIDMYFPDGRPKG